ncbi:MAG: type I 3-dehydroquinate dehydratase [Firmicutes bacterium]|nr:type I 3-dehydroquinate dehydratase [Bacillota bacterium]
MRFFKREERSMRPKICLSLNCRTIEDLIEELEEFKEYAEVIEWCVDKTEGADQYSEEEFAHKLLMVKSFCDRKPLIIDYKGDEEIGNRIQRWAMGRADIIDIDADNTQIHQMIKEAKKKKTKTLISYHVFDHMMSKDEIATQLLRMEKTKGDILKVACFAEKEIDTYEVLEAASAYTKLSKHKPIVAIAMGEEGQVSRICAGEFGSIMTYACGKEATAPGQFNARDLSRYLDKYYKGK